MQTKHKMNVSPGDLITCECKLFIYLERYEYIEKYKDEKSVSYFRHTLFDIEKEEIIRRWGYSHLFKCIVRFNDCLI